MPVLNLPIALTPEHADYVLMAHASTDVQQTTKLLESQTSWLLNAVMHAMILQTAPTQVHAVFVSTVLANTDVQSILSQTP